MATADTVELSAAHEPKEASIVAFTQILPEVKSSLIHLRKTQNSAVPRPSRARQLLI